MAGLLSYVASMPSVTKDAHVLYQVHGTYLAHPLLTSALLFLLGLCMYMGNEVIWSAWIVLAVIFTIHTGAIIVRLMREDPVQGGLGRRRQWIVVLLNLVLGGELVTLASGARPIFPWRLKSLPEDTWIVDVRTKPEFHWNRLQGAESFPWGAGLLDAAKERSKSRPVLLTCFSGHRSPAIALALRNVGFQQVYNLNWGILYLMLLERGKKGTGPFSLTRPNRDPNRRGEDLKAITLSYIVLILTTLVGAPLEYLYMGRVVPLWQLFVGLVPALIGLGLAFWSLLALGRNFRPYAAPRRSGTLVTTGIYAWVRHPMYSGIIVGLAGYILIFGSIYFIPAWAAITALYLLKAVKEERILAAKFPEYDDYCKRTWRFLPYLL
ncbi:methyltransferase [Thermodesulfobacteriota bacterium]